MGFWPQKPINTTTTISYYVGHGPTHMPTAGGDSIKIEFESGAKVIGTKRVSAKGQVSGLTEYAGKDVMIILVPEDGTVGFSSSTAYYFYVELT